MEVSDLHRSLGLESLTPHTLLSTDAGEKVYPSVCPLRSPLKRSIFLNLHLEASVKTLEPRSSLRGISIQLVVRQRYQTS